MATDNKGKDPEDKNATSSATDDGKKTDLEQQKAINQQLLLQNQKLQTDMDDLKGTVISPQYQAFVESQKNKPGQYSATDFAAGRGQETVDLETMDRAQFAQYIGQMIDGKLDSTVNPQIGQMQQSIQRDQLNRSIKDARDKHSDFDNHRLKMTQISSRIEKSGITADDLYLIASHPGTTKPEKEETTTEKPGAGGDVPPSGKEETVRETADRIGDKLFGD